MEIGQISCYRLLADLYSALPHLHQCLLDEVHTAAALNTAVEVGHPVATLDDLLSLQEGLAGKRSNCAPTAQALQLPLGG